jgi:cardiolipin hydrolase
MDIHAILTETLADHRLSPAEKRALGEVLTEHVRRADDVAHWRNVAFDVARSHLDTVAGDVLLDWLQAVMKVLARALGDLGGPTEAEARFSPGEGPRRRIRDLVATAKESIDVCVFTLTDDTLTEVLVAAHRRGVRVRVVSDDQKAMDRGSDIDVLEAAGVAVATDDSHAHMHHKFAIFDGRRLLSGSYNWTRSAAVANQENVLVTDDRRLVRAYQGCFDDLWEAFSG